MVKGAQANQFGLTAQKLNLASLLEFQAILYLDVLFCRHGHQSNVPAQLGHNTALDETIGNAEQVGDLRIVSASMCSTGGRIRIGMLWHDDGIHLTHIGDRGAAGLALQHALDPGDGQASLVRNA